MSKVVFSNRTSVIRNCRITEVDNKAVTRKFRITATEPAKFFIFSQFVTQCVGESRGKNE